MEVRSHAPSEQQIVEDGLPPLPVKADDSIPIRWECEVGSLSKAALKKSVVVCARVWCVRACVRVCVRVCVRACVRACVCVCVCGARGQYTSERACMQFNSFDN
jgi:hypothetical protein